MIFRSLLTLTGRADTLYPPFFGVNQYFSSEAQDVLLLTESKGNLPPAGGRFDSLRNRHERQN